MFIRLRRERVRMRSRGCVRGRMRFIVSAGLSPCFRFVFILSDETTCFAARPGGFVSPGRVAL
jgi:hypothetical protein